VGKIDVTANRTYVAIAREHADAALAGLAAGKIKGKKARVSRLG
jgi:ATP-independent RNA helicase DbpA